MPSVTVPIISMTTPSSSLMLKRCWITSSGRKRISFTASATLPAFDLAVEAGLARQRRVHAVGQDHHVGVHLAALAVAAHADAALAVHQQFFHRGLADQQRAGFAHLGR
jgi:hypothetical protein